MAIMDPRFKQMVLSSIGLPAIEPWADVTLRP
jgi:hypothetical protein